MKKTFCILHFKHRRVQWSMRFTTILYIPAAGIFLKKLYEKNFVNEKNDGGVKNGIFLPNRQDAIVSPTPSFGENRLLHPQNFGSEQVIGGVVFEKWLVDERCHHGAVAAAGGVVIFLMPAEICQISFSCE